MPPKILAIEGVGGVGKSRLVSVLRHAFLANTPAFAVAPITMKRPSNARWEAFTQLTPTTERLDALMDYDALMSVQEAHSHTQVSWAVFDRHWLSGVVYQSPSPAHATLHGRLLQKRAMIGEPDVWVLLTADADTIAAALRSREPDGERAHLDTAFSVEAALERQKQMINLFPHLKSPLLHIHRTGETYQIGITPSRLSLTEVRDIILNIMQEQM